MNVSIILAGGTGGRFGSPKQFARIGGKYIVEYAIEAFERNALVDEIYIVIHKDHYDKMVDISKAYTKVTKVLVGGATRQESSKIGVVACGDEVTKVLIHDAVRPFVSDRIITEVIESLDNYHAVDVAIPATDTIISSSSGLVDDIPDRRVLYYGQTPQGFRREIIQQAHIAANTMDHTDDISLLTDVPIKVVRGDPTNIKITYPIDIDIADKILQVNLIGVPESDCSIAGNTYVVIGGTSGIGNATVDLLRASGATCLSASSRTGCHITDSSDIKQLLKRIRDAYGPIDGVVCTAAVLYRGSIVTMDDGWIHEQVAINLTGNILVAKESLPYLIETHGHLVVFASSSYTRGRPGYSVYSATKAGLVNFVQGFADEVSPYGVKVNAINPARTDTPMRRANFDDDPGTLLSPETVAQKVIDLLKSDDITGAVVDVRK